MQGHSTDLQTLRRALGGDICNGQVLCPGPGHSARDRSLAVRPSPDGFVVFSHAGDDWKTCSDYVRSRLNLPQWQPSNDRRERQAPAIQCDRNNGRAERARGIWAEGSDPRDTAAERYLASRKLILTAQLCVTVLRFHPSCPWENGVAPCLVAAFRSIVSNDVTGIHRIRLDQPERWPKADRKMLGTVSGSAVKVDAVGTSLVIGEGVETCLAARQLGLRPVWALGSSVGIKEFQCIDNVDELRILGERDTGANSAAADECWKRWAGRNVFRMLPPGGFKDFNDLVMERKNASA